VRVAVDLPEDDVALPDEYVRSAGLVSRSGMVRCAMQLLRYPHLELDYAEAWDEWISSGEVELWDRLSATS
jgi:hypothetical protein